MDFVTIFPTHFVPYVNGGSKAAGIESSPLTKTKSHNSLILIMMKDTGLKSQNSILIYEGCRQWHVLISNTLPKSKYTSLTQEGSAI